MEPLSNILKQLPHLSMNDAVLRKQSELLTHPLVQQFRQNHPALSESALMSEMNRLYVYVREATHCERCPGLDRCPNDLTGHYTKLLVEIMNDQEQIYDVKVPCNKWIAKQAQESIHKRIRSFYVDDRALNEGYSAEEILNVDPLRMKAVKQVLEYIVQTKREGLQKNGLYLFGSFGTGKTFIMCYMLYELAKSGYSGTIVYMPDFMEDLKAMFQEPWKLKETIEWLKNTDLLVFDDIGAENLNPWARDHVMGTILNYRMNRKPTFFTSNYDLDALQQHFSFTNRDGEEEYKGQRIMDRIRPFVQEVEVLGENKRGKL